MISQRKHLSLIFSFSFLHYKNELMEWKYLITDNGFCQSFIPFIQSKAKYKRKENLIFSQRKKKIINK